jgi:plasmid stabilization system protein ParE
MAKIEISAVAQSDRADMLQYFFDCGALDAYYNIKNAIDNVLDNLQSFPNSGAPVKIPGYSHYKFKYVKPYLILYIYEKDTVKIQRVVHASRDYKRLLDLD